MRAGLAILGALAACALLGCRSTDGGAPIPTRIDVGAGDSAAIARRAALALADDAVLAARAPHVADADQRYFVRIDHRAHAGSTRWSGFEREFENALVGTGRFLLVKGTPCPSVRTHISGSIGAEDVRIEFLGPGGELWVEVRGRAVPLN